jgi:hypothetical protein
MFLSFNNFKSLNVSFRGAARLELQRDVEQSLLGHVVRA